MSWAKTTYFFLTLTILTACSKEEAFLVEQSTKIDMAVTVTDDGIKMEWDNVNNDDFESYVIIRSNNQEFVSGENCKVMDTLAVIEEIATRIQLDEDPLFNDTVYYQIFVALENNFFSSEIKKVFRSDLQYFDYMPRDIVNESWYNTITLTERYSLDRFPSEAYRYHTYSEKDLKFSDFTHEAPGRSGYVSYDSLYEGRVLAYYPGNQFIYARNLADWGDFEILNASTSAGVDLRNYVQSAVRNGCCLIIGLSRSAFSFYNFNNGETEDPYNLFETLDGRLINSGDFTFLHLNYNWVEKYSWDAGFFVSKEKTLGQSGLDINMLAVDENAKLFISGAQGNIIDFDLNLVKTLADFEKYNSFTSNPKGAQFLGSIDNEKRIDIIDINTFEVSGSITTKGYPERIVIMDDELIAFSTICTNDLYYFEHELIVVERFPI